jgi:hypothetical protein
MKSKVLLLGLVVAAFSNLVSSQDTRNVTFYLDKAATYTCGTPSADAKFGVVRINHYKSCKG